MKKYEKWWSEHADPETFLTTPHPRTKDVRNIIVEIGKSLLAPRSFVLDVGCGTALDYPLWTAAGYEYVGIDFTQEFIDYALNKYGYSVIKVYKQDAREIEFWNRQQIDLVYCKDLLEHLGPGDWKTVVNEMWRVADKAIIIAFFKPPICTQRTKYHIVTEAENPETAGVYSNWYSRFEVLEHLKSFNPKWIRIRNSIAYKPKWEYGKGWSIWTIRRR